MNSSHLATHPNDTWRIEVDGAVESRFLATVPNPSSQWAALAETVLTPQYLQYLADSLRQHSILADLVGDQLFHHLLKVYQDRVETTIQSEGIEAIDTSQPHLKVVSQRRKSGKRVEFNFDGDRIREYLRNSLSEFFTQSGIWQEFAKAVGANLIVGVLDEMQDSEVAAAFQTHSLEALSTQIKQQLQLVAPDILKARSEVLGQLHCQDIAKRILEGFNLPNCSLSDLEKLLGLKQRPPTGTTTVLDLDPVAVLPTAIPIASSIRAQLRPDLWTQDPDEIAVFQYRSKSNPNNYIEHYITSPGDIAMLPWEAAEQIINKFGFDTVKLQLIFAARTMEEDEPWNRAFTLRATDIIQLLGWDRNHNTGLSEKRIAIASTAHALSCLLVKSVWIEGKGGRKVDASTPIGRMWDVLIDLHGQFDWITGKIDKPEEVYITVSPGLWTKHFLNRAGNKAKEALYQFGYLAKDILKIDPYHNELALRLAIQLTLDSRIRARNQNPYEYRVGGLLEEVLLQADIIRALEDKHKARDLKNRWNNALTLLKTLGWQIEFDEETYPEWLRPNSQAPKPEDWRKIRMIERLMQAKLIIMPPHPIPALLSKLKEPKKPKMIAAAPCSELTGEHIRQAREVQGWSRKELGGFLNVSADYVGKLERGDRSITTELETRLRKLLRL